jgi:hypothetical protein
MPNTQLRIRDVATGSLVGFDIRVRIVLSAQRLVRAAWHMGEILARQPRRLQTKLAGIACIRSCPSWSPQFANQSEEVDLTPGFRFFVRGGKGAKDRSTLLAVLGRDELRAHLQRAEARYRDRASGLAGVWLPDALERKSPNASREQRAHSAEHDAQEGC